MESNLDKAAKAYAIILAIATAVLMVAWMEKIARTGPPFIHWTPVCMGGCPAMIDGFVIALVALLLVGPFMIWWIKRWDAVGRHKANMRNSRDLIDRGVDGV